MPGILTRSKSLRFLKNTRKDAIEQENGDSMPPLKGSQTDFDKYPPTIHESRAEEKLGASDMAIRPATSGGPGERPLMFHKKTNPIPSVFSQDVAHSFQSPTSSTTVLYNADVTKEQGIIGIALGSPSPGSHFNSTPQNAGFKTDSRFPNASMASFSQPNGSSTSISARQEAPKSKLSRWKSLFRKATPPPPPEKPSFYQLAQTTTTVPRADSHHEEEVQEPQAPVQEEKEILRTVSPPAYKPNIRASRKWAPGEFVAPQSPPETLVTRERALTLGNSTSHHQPSMSIQRAFTTPNLAPRSTPDELSLVPHVMVSKSASDTLPDEPAVPATEGPLLEISLPDITLERYSVMFGNLLQSEPSRSSLLMRRQGNAEKLLPLNALSSKERAQEQSLIDYSLQRRATSPTPASSSPRLSLFPSTYPTRAPSPLAGSIMNRSKKDIKRTRTDPAKSPLRLTSQNLEEQTKADSAMLKPIAPPYLKPVLTPTSIHSFESEADSVTIIVAQASPSHPFKVHLDDREPEWEIMTRPVLKAAKSEILLTSSALMSPLTRSPSQRQPQVTKLSALSSHPSSAPLDAPSPLQRLQSLSTPPHSAGVKRAEIQARRQEAKVDDVGTAKAMVGVARSISVSRANSPRAVVHTMTSPNEDRLGSGLALTPTMVEVRNRKSQRVQLVDA